MTQSLMTVRYTDDNKKIWLSAYADTVVYGAVDGRNTLCAIRFGGYPEQVSGMVQAIHGGGDVTVEAGKGTFVLKSLAKQYRRSISHDGVYAEAVMEGIKDAINFPDGVHSGKSMLILARSGDLYAYAHCDKNGGMCPQTERKRFGNTPIKVLSGVENVYWGHYFSLVLLKNGRLYSSGINTQGQCGRGRITIGNGSNRPQHVMSDVIDAAAGRLHGMALQANGDLWIWGGEYGLSDISINGLE